MIINITSLSMNYGPEGLEAVQVYFNANDQEGYINLNGYIPLTPQEYEGNEPINSLKQVVKLKIAEKLEL